MYDYDLPIYDYPSFSPSENALLAKAMPTLYSKSWVNGAHHFYQSSKDAPWKKIAYADLYGNEVCSPAAESPMKEVYCIRLSAPKKINIMSGPRSCMRAFGKLSKISHCHLPKYLGSFSTISSINIIAPKPSYYLTSYLDEGRYDVELVRTWFGCLASAVDYLHTQNSL